MRVKALNYFKTSDNKVVYPATTWKRFAGRAIDLMLSVIVGRTMLSIYLSTAFKIPSEGAKEFVNYIPSFADPMVWVSWFMIFLGIITFNIIIPLLNRKNPGQSVGKMIMGTTPLYLSDKPVWKSILIREIPISILYLIPLIFTMMSGVEINFMYSQYAKWLRATDVETIPSFWSYLNNESMKEATGNLSVYQVVMVYFSKVFNYLLILTLPAIFITIAFNPMKRGGHDSMASTAVVDLRTVMTEEESNQMIERIKDAPEKQEGEEVETNNDEPPIDLNIE